MANIPSNIGHGIVTGQFLVATADTNDIDTRPDAAAVGGTITFTPSRNYVQNPSGAPNASTVLLKTETAIIDSEGYVCNTYIDAGTGSYARGFPLVATDGADVNPEGWTWKVTYNFTYGGKGIAGPASHSLQIPTGGTIDLTTAVPVDESGGTITIQGPAGPAGPANLVVGDINTLTQAGIWVQTNYGGPDDFTIWIEDGQ